jgi:6-phosphofructokinase 1
VVQNIVFTLTDYGVPEDQILGIRYGLRGFYEREDKPITLTRDTVDGIHLKGGTMLVRRKGEAQGGLRCREVWLITGRAWRLAGRRVLSLAVKLAV